MNRPILQQIDDDKPDKQEVKTSHKARELTPREIVRELDNYVIGQDKAKKAVAIALRNRWRRQRVEEDLREEIMPNNIIMIGPTGVGKTETSKALSEIYFGSEEKMIRLDMSEFQAIPDIPRLIGSPGQEGLLTTKVREAPFSLILLGLWLIFHRKLT